MVDSSIPVVGADGLTKQIDTVLLAGEHIIKRVNVDSAGTEIDFTKMHIPKTAFGDVRTAELSPIFQYSFEYTVDNTDLMTNTVANGGTITQANGMGICTTSTTTGSTAMLQTKTHAKYKTGLGGMLRYTTIFTPGVATTEQYAGLADVVGSSAAFKNGYMVGFDGDTFGFHRFQNDVKTSVAQSAWDDPLDGTGASGMTIDLTKLNVWQIQYQYLGGGAIILSVESDSTGNFVEVHRILYANLNITPSTYNPNYHGILFVNNAGTTSNLILSTASVAYFSEGKSEFTFLHRPQQSTGLISKSGITSEIAMFTIRNKALYATKDNFVDILLERIVASIEANAANNLGSVRLVKNATLGGTPSYTDINTTNSVVDIDIAGTTVTGGTEILPIPLAGRNDKEGENLMPYRIILQANETLTVAGFSSNQAIIEVSGLWKELF